MALFDSPIKTDEKVIHQGVPTPTNKPTAAELIKLAETGELKGRLAAVLDRARTTQRMHVKLPPELYGEWVKNDPIEIAEKQQLGFEIDKQYAINRGFNATGAEGESVVADVIFMTAPRQVKDVLNQIEQERIRDRHEKRGNMHKEERDFANLTRNDTGGEIPTVVESSESDLTIDMLRSLQQQVPS